MGTLTRMTIAIVGLALLPLASLLSYELFHTLAEVLFAVVAFSVLIMAWTLRSFLDDDFPVFLGIALAAAGLLHLLHMADFPGVDMISGVDLDPPTQLWISARLLVAVSFVIAPFVLGRRLHLRLVALAYLAVDALVVLTVYTWDVFPVTLEETGLTQFKVISEYVVMGLFGIAIWLLWRRRSQLPPGALRLLIAALMASIAAELFFTLYVGPHTWPNLVGHLFLGLSAILVYVAVVEDGLARPHQLAVTGLREAQVLNHRLQQGLLPSFDLRRDDVLVLSEYIPGEHHLQLGGDFLDVVDLGDQGLAVICGDVSGHSPESAALGTTLRVSWESLVLSHTPPSELVNALHQVLVREREDEDTFATLCLAWIDPDRDEMKLLTLGHPLPLVMDGSVSRVTVTPVPPLGVLDKPAGEPERVPLPPLWRLLFYTDGLIEGRAAPGSSERFGEAGLISALEALTCGPIDKACINGVVERIRDAGGEPFSDDVAVVVIGKRQ